MFDALFAVPDELTALLGPALNSRETMPAMERLHWLFLLSGLVLALASWWRFGRHEAGGGFGGFLRFAFPRKVYFHKSALVDLKVWLAGYIFRHGFFAARLALTAVIAVAVLGALERIGHAHCRSNARKDRQARRGFPRWPEPPSRSAPSDWSRLHVS